VANPPLVVNKKQTKSYTNLGLVQSGFEQLDPEHEFLKMQAQESPLPYKMMSCIPLYPSNYNIISLPNANFYNYLKDDDCYPMDKCKKNK